MKNPTARLIAFYLPQYYPIPENDKWWGKGFTEWTNVAKAKPLFKGHIQPKLPADLGFYDLRVPEVRELQANLARDAGIEGFCYWHYWFGHGKRLLDRPFTEVLRSGRPNFPFCLAWANESWSGIWHGAKDKILQEQLYPGKDDYKKHFDSISNAFLDHRYITIDEKPLFVIYKPDLVPDLSVFVDVFREKAHKRGLKGMHISGYYNSNPTHPQKLGLDSSIYSNFSMLDLISKKKFNRLYFKRKYNQLLYIIKKRPIKIYSYKDACRVLDNYEDFGFEYFPVAIPNWDNSPRSNVYSNIITNSTPELFEKHLLQMVKRIENRKFENRIVFIKSWNEWAEGNYLEPDSVFKHAYLEAVKNVMRDK